MWLKTSPTYRKWLKVASRIVHTYLVTGDFGMCTCYKTMADYHWDHRRQRRHHHPLRFDCRCPSRFVGGCYFANLHPVHRWYDDGIEVVVAVASVVAVDVATLDPYKCYCKMLHLFRPMLEKCGNSKIFVSNEQGQRVYVRVVFLTIWWTGFLYLLYHLFATLSQTLNFSD